MENENYPKVYVKSDDVENIIDKCDCYTRSYPSGSALEDAYNAGRKDGRKEGFCEGYEKGLKDGCKKIKEKALHCIDKIECY